MDLLDITDATMAAALSTAYGRLLPLAEKAGGETFATTDEVDAATVQLGDASRQLHRYLYGKDHLPDEAGEANDLDDLVSYATAIGGGDATWESYISDARDA